jgi:hypothetical protein
MFRSLIAFLFIASTAFGQIDISWTTQKSVSGLVNPRTVGARVLVAEESIPVATRVAIVKVTTSAKFVKLSARKSLFEFADLEKLSDNEWLITSPGKYLVEAVTFDPDKGIDERRIEITLGEPEPVPPPKPDPIPVPPPKPDVANAYNVGQISYVNAPKKPTEANAISSIYRVGASKLFGANNVLLDIEGILKEIDSQFVAKTPKDTGWVKWKVSVSDAMKAEQINRKTFSRQDWYACLIEVAASLEAVK